MKLGDNVSQLCGGLGVHRTCLYRWSHLLKHFKISGLQNFLHRVPIETRCSLQLSKCGIMELRVGFCVEVVVNRLMAFLPNRSLSPLPELPI
jgi:hypothetical protein